MDIKYILQETWITDLLFVACMIVGILLIKTKDLKYLRGIKEPTTTPYKNPEEFAKRSGILIVLLGVCSLIMSVLLMFTAVVASVFGGVVFIGFAFMWKRMNDEYGPKAY